MVGAGAALLTALPAKEAIEVESDAPIIGNLAGLGGGGSSEPVEPAIKMPLTVIR